MSDHPSPTPEARTLAEELRSHAARLPHRTATWENKNRRLLREAAAALEALGGERDNESAQTLNVEPDASTNLGGEQGSPSVEKNHRWKAVSAVAIGSGPVKVNWLCEDCGIILAGRGPDGGCHASTTTGFAGLQAPVSCPSCVRLESQLEQALRLAKLREDHERAAINLYSAERGRVSELEQELKELRDAQED